MKTNEERRKAAEWFRNRAKNCPMQGAKRMYEIATEALEERERNKQPHWIPVTERLPKENGFYLCLYKHKASGGVAMDEGLSILQWINNKWGINDIYLVTHWVPIPEPPEKESTNG